MLKIIPDPTLRYRRDNRTVSPRDGTCDDGWPESLDVTSDAFFGEVALCHLGVAQIKRGGLPVTALEAYNLPSSQKEFPAPLRELIEHEALRHGVTFGFAFAAIVKMDPWRMMANVMIDNALALGATFNPELIEKYSPASDYPDNPDLIARIALDNRVALGIEDRMTDTFNAKNARDYPRPWLATSLDDEVAATLLTCFADPIREAGAGHSETPPGHAANAAEAYAVLRKLLVAAEDVHRSNEYIARLCAQGRSAGGLHLWYHVKQTFDHVIGLHRVDSLI